MALSTLKPDGTQGTAIVELTYENGKEIRRRYGCMVKNDANLKSFIKTHIKQSADKTKFKNSKYYACIYDPGFEEVERNKTTVSCHRFSKPSTPKKCELNFSPHNFVKVQGHIFIPCDSQHFNDSNFLEKHSKKILVAQELREEMYGLMYDEKNKFPELIPVKLVDQLSPNMYGIGAEDYKKLEDAGPVLLEDNETVVGSFKKRENNEISISIFGNNQEITTASSTDGAPGDGTEQPAATPGDGTEQPAATPGDGTGQPTATPGDGTEQPAATPGDGTGQPTATPGDGTEQPAATPGDGTGQPTATPGDGTEQPAATPGDGTGQPTATPGDGTEKPAATPGDGTGQPTATPGDGTEQPAATPGDGTGQPTATPGDGTEQPAATPGDGTGQPTATPGDGTEKPAATPGDGTGQPTATPGDGTGQPTATPGDGTEQPAATPGDGTEQPAATPGDGTGQPTATPGDGTEQPAATPGDGTGQPTATPGDGTEKPAATPGDGTGQPTATPGDGTEQPAATPGDGTGQPTATPGDGTEQPAATPGDGTGQPTATPGDGTEKPAATPGDGTGQPTATPGDGTGQPTATPGDGTEQPAATPGDGTEQPAATPGDGTGQPTVTPGDGTGQPAATPGDGTGQPAATPGDGTGQPAATLGDGTGQAAATPGDGTGQQTLANLFKRKNSVLDGLCLRLDNEYRVMRNWKHLADLLDAPTDVKDRCKCSTKHSPTELLFEVPNVSSTTVTVLIKVLREMGRNDVDSKITQKITEENRNKKVSETLLNDYDLCDEVALQLDKESPLNNNWKKLGKKLKVSKDILQQFERGNNPANQLFLHAYSTLEAEKLKGGYFRNLIKEFRQRKDVEEFLDTLGVSLQDDRSIKDVFPPDSDNLRDLCDFMNKNAGNTLKDWRFLASAWEIEYDIYNSFDKPEKPKPTKILLEDWLIQANEDFTVQQLCTHLKTMKRIDAQEYLENEARS